MRSPLVVLALVCVARAAAADPAPAPAAPAPAGPTNDEALARARAAEARARAGDYAGAVVMFKQAFALDARAEYACNVGVAYYKARDLPRAQLFLDACLLSGADLPRDFVASVWRVLETVEAKLRQGEFAPIDLRVAPATTQVRVSNFADDEPVIGARRIWLPVGRHQLVATAPGHTSRRFEIEVVSRQAQRVDVVLPLEPASSPPADTAKPPTPVEAAPAPVAPAPVALAPVVIPTPAQAAASTGPAPIFHVQPRRRGSAAQTLATIGTVLTVTTLAISVAIYSAGSDSEPDEYGYDSGEPARAMGIMGFTFSAILGGATTLLWIRAADQNKTMSMGASPSKGGGQVWLGGHF